jgi:hypothetical protein
MRRSELLSEMTAPKIQFSTYVLVHELTDRLVIVPVRVFVVEEQKLVECRP